MATFFESGTCLRVNGAQLQSVDEGSTVLLVGEMKSPGILSTSDGAEVRLEGDATPESGIVEVVGKKVNGSCIKTMRCTRLEGDFDMGNYDGLQKLIANSEYKVLFTTQATAH